MCLIMDTDDYSTSLVHTLHHQTRFLILLSLLSTNVKQPPSFVHEKLAALSKAMFVQLVSMCGVGLMSMILLKLAKSILRFFPAASDSTSTSLAISAAILRDNSR